VKGISGIEKNHVLEIVPFLFLGIFTGNEKQYHQE
jgi:hypothetical protein